MEISGDHALHASLIKAKLEEIATPGSVLKQNYCMMISVNAQSALHNAKMVMEYKHMYLGSKRVLPP